MLDRGVAVAGRLGPASSGVAENVGTDGGKGPAIISSIR